MRRIAIAAGPGTALEGPDGAAWYRATTARIDLMKRVVDQIGTDLRDFTAGLAADAQRIFTIIAAAAAGLLALSLLVAWDFARTITRPVGAMTGAMERLAGGDLETAIPARDNQDEIGAMAKALQVFKDNALEVRRMEAEQAAQKERAEAEKKAALAAMANAFESGVGGVVKADAAASTELQSAATSMSAPAEQASQRSTAVAAASEQAAGNVQTVASAAEELTSSVAEISRQVATSTRITGDAVDQANSTNATVHQPVEHVASLRAMPNLLVLRPCDTVETPEAWEIDLSTTTGPSMLVLSRQNLPTLRTDVAENKSARGAYVLSAASAAPKAVLFATGSETYLAIDAQKALEEKGIPTQVVSVPSFELFAKQDDTYRASVLGGQGVVRAAIEAGVRQGWVAIIGSDGIFVGMKGFGESAPAPVLYKHFGITAEAVVEAVSKKI